MNSNIDLSILKGKRTKAPSPNLRLQTLFEKNAELYPQHTAIIYPDVKGKTWSETYREVDLGSNRLCRGMLELVGSVSANQDGDHVVAVAMAPSNRLLKLLVAVWRAGAAYLPIDHNAPPERTRHILNEARPVLVVTEDDGNKESCGTLMITYSKLEKDSEPLSDSRIDVQEVLPCTHSPLAIVLYTSGSTGVPKGVRISHGAIMNRLDWQWQEFPYKEDEETLVFKTALTFGDSIGEIWGPLLHHRPRTVLVVPRELTKDPHSLIRLLHLHKIQRLVLVPSLLRSVLWYMNLPESNIRLLERLDLWVCSGEPLPVSLAQQFLDTFKHTDHVLCNFYGSTEVMADVTYHVIANSSDADFQGKVPIGVPIYNTAIYLLDGSLRPVAQGEIGELFAAGRNLASGYVNKRDPHRFIENHLTVDADYKYLYRTGDYARLVKGVIVFEGRTDSQIKVRGHRVDLAEVENALCNISGIKKAVVLCYKPAEINQAIVGFILPQDNTILFEKDVEVMLETFLPAYSIPQVVVIDRMPLLVSGKVDRQYLLKHFEQLCYKDNKSLMEFDLSGIDADKWQLAEVLFSTVASVLGTRSSIRSDANFFSLGGNSLNSVYTVTLLREKGYVISISDFVSARNLKEIIGKMKRDTDDISSCIKMRYNKFSYEILKHNHKTDVYRIIIDSFCNRGALGQWIKPLIRRKDYTEYLNNAWDILLEQQVSFVVLSEDGKPVGVSLNYDAYDEPKFDTHGGLRIISNFLEFLAEPIRKEKLAKGKGEILHSKMLGTAEELSTWENVEVMEYMEAMILELAKQEGFLSTFCTNTSPLTQQLGTILNYSALHSYQVNQYTAADGSTPFKDAPNSQVAVCYWKLLS